MLFEPPLQIEVPGEVPLTLFQTSDELLAWFGAERDAWRAISTELARNDDPVLGERFAEFQQLLDRSVKDVKVAMGQTTPLLRYQGMLDTYAERLRNGTLVGSKGFRGRFVLELAATDPLLAARVALSLRKVAVNIASSQWGTRWARAGALAELLDRGWLNEQPNVTAFMSDFVSTWDKRLSAHHEAQKENTTHQDQILTGMTEAMAELQGVIAGSKTESGELIVSLRGTVQDAIAKGQAEIEAIKETYKAELTLQAPTTYWKAKQIAHRWLAALWALGFAALAAAAVSFVAEVWVLTAEPRFADNAVPSYGVFLPVLGAAFLSVWVLRIVSRQLLTQFVLSSDAGERVAMVKTFLALMQKPDHVKEADRVLILSALFRPAGKSEDDATPPNWFDLLMHRVKS